MLSRLTNLAIMFLLFAYGGIALASERFEYTDPRFPEERQDTDRPIRTRSVVALEKQLRQLEEQLAQLPSLESRIAPQHEYFGYLSTRHPVSSTNDLMNAWINLTFSGKWTDDVDGMALVPAYYPSFSAEENYGFPKRFRIDVFSHNSPDVPITIVDWTKEDFPDPGLHPVFFSFPEKDVKSVKLTVTKGISEGNFQFFALDELMVFQRGNNVAPPAYQRLTASDSYDAPPYWKLQYLTNRRIHVGNYYHTFHQTEDFIQYFDTEAITFNTPRITIDLGSVRSVGRVEFYPAKIKDVPIPEFGFPLKYQIALLTEQNGQPVTESQIIEKTAPSRMRWHALSSNKGRYLRLSLIDLPRHNGLPVFAMGEIRVMGRQQNQINNFATEKNIITKNFPQDTPADTALLVDGFSNGRKIIMERSFIQQLAERKILEKELAEARHRLVIARATRSSYFWTIGISGGTILLFSLLFWIAYQRAARQRALMNLRQQIAADLHDDISANLGTISMITRRLQQDTSPSLLKQKLTEIGHIAQESFISVKEIIWHMDSDVVYLSEMFEQLEKTAGSILSDCRVECRFPSPQGIPVPAKIRRNMMLLMKEALYNCAKYAEAKHMLIEAEIQDMILKLSMKDDGIGFDPSCTLVASSDSGRGLSNMERRAKLLGAELEVQSKPDEGTQVTLRIPLK
ncbi:ATP-binding protein [Pontiellaceae bacterium B12227]|nr:ATP-binding protein [Pontiellaceae bacterium B12227]